jgi:hypothetical protein
MGATNAGGMLLAAGRETSRSIPEQVPDHHERIAAGMQPGRLIGAGLEVGADRVV